MCDDDVEDVNQCDHCGADTRDNEMNIMGYGYRFCDDCSCMDSDEFEKLYGEQ